MIFKDLGPVKCAAWLIAGASALLPLTAHPGGEPIQEDPVTAGVIMDLSVEELVGRWEAQRSLSGRIRHLDREAREQEPYRSEVMNRRHKALLTLGADGSYTWKAETGEVLRGRWTRTGEAHAPVQLRNGERGNDWTITPTGKDGGGVLGARIAETTGTLAYTARKVDEPTTATRTRENKRMNPAGNRRPR